MIFIVGHHATGKTFGAKILESFGFFLIDTGPIIRNIYSRSGVNIYIDQWVKDGEAIKGKDYTNYIITEEIKNIISNVIIEKGIIIIGNRSMDGIKYLQKNLNFYNSKNLIIYIDALFEKMRYRYNKRENKKLTVNEFSALIEKEKKCGLDEIREQADFILSNNGSEKELKARLMEIIFNK